MVRVSPVLKCLSLMLLFVLVMMCSSPAFAADAASWKDVENLVNAGNNVNITLKKDMVATSGLNIGSKTVTIDLNGHTITVADNVGRLFDSWEGNLTIKDSVAITKGSEGVSMPARDSNSATTVPNGTGIGRSASFSDGVLTYYETTSAVENTIYTVETHKKVTVNVKGGIVRSNQSNAALIGLGGGNASLTIEGGFFSNPTGRVAEINNGADVTITGGVFYGCNTNGSGGAIYVDSWTDQRAQFSISNAIFAGNIAVSGGAVATNGKVDLFINAGAVFSGNRATGSGHDGGGAIMVGWDTVAKLNGGLVTHNWCTDNVTGSGDGNSSYDVCGGGIMVRGVLEMTGGQVTCNEAPGGGGISTSFWDGGVFVMRDGIVAGNVARLNEGGGITINMNGRGSITGGHITNNKAEGKEHWGGGGIFAANDSMLTMISTLISENEAGGFGGGLAGCSTARVDTHAVEIQNHSVAIYGNTAQGKNLSGNNSTKNEDHLYAYSDPVFMREGAFYQDYFSALNTTVCGGFLGQGNSNWAGTIDGEVINQGDIKPGEKVSSQSVAGLSSNPENSDIAKAKDAARVFVTGNVAYTHGGGILSNGYMIIGPQRTMEIGDRMTLVGDKTLSGGQLEDGQFKFAVADTNNHVLFTGTNNADSEIIFNGRLSFDKAGTYTYKVYELRDETFPENVTMDPTVYTIVVNVTSTKKTVQAVDDDDITKADVVEVTYNKISGVTVYKSDVDEPVLHLDNIETDDRSAYMLPGNVLQFVNRTSTDTGFVVSKTVHDASHSSANVEFGFTVTLSNKNINGTHGDMTFNDGVASFTLKSGQSKKAIDLPAGTTYSITEEAKSGYYNPNPIHHGTVVGGSVGSVVFENTAVGSLKVTKTVQSPNPNDAERDFDFRITLLPNDGRTATYSGVTFTNGVAIVELKGGESLTIDNLPAGKEYNVEELTSEGFTVVADDATGVIVSGQTKTAAFANTRQTGELHVKKYVVDESNQSADTEFTFTVTLTDASYINGQYGDMDFANGVATFTLKGGEVKKATGLPLGIHYRVSEPHDSSTEEQHLDYAVSIVGNENGVITAVPSVVEFTNTKFAGLVISKVTTGSALDRDTAFAFEITLKDENGKVLSGTYSGVEFVNGKATIYLKDGQNKVFDDLKGDMQVTVTEHLEGEAQEHFLVQVNGQTATGTPTFTHELKYGHSAHAHFTNLHRVGSLEISKTTVSPIEADKNHLFVFTVELSAPISGTFGDMFFTDGRATVYLMNGQSLKAENIPVGVTYKVTEQAENAFVSNPAGPVTGTISEAGTTIAYTNTRRLGGLKLTKTVQGAEASDEAFGFKVILDSAYTGEFGEMTFIDGVAEFILKDGDSIEATGLPEGTVYEIVETTYDSLQYVPVTEHIVGNITHDIVKQVNFINRALSSLTVIKRVEGREPDAQKFKFTVELSDKTFNGTCGDMTFVDGVATFELAHGESKTATHLPTSITYKVTEEADVNYTTASIGAEGTIVANRASSAVFTNTWKTGALKVTKTVAGDVADITDRFTFTVTLNEALNGIYGDMSFENGVATFELGHGESKTATDLLAGVTYTVREHHSGYVTTVNDVSTDEATGQIAADVETIVNFVNTKTEETGGLSVKKTVAGSEADKQTTFEFIVTLDNLNINGYYATVDSATNVAADNGMTFENGVAKFTLKDGEVRIADGLPVGTEFTVTEEANDAFTAIYSGETGYIVKDSTHETVVTNVRKASDLTVSKSVVSATESDKAKEFTFTVTLNDNTINGVYGDMSFTNGVATFVLKDGESKTATGIPTGTTYTVEETIADGFSTKADGETGMILDTMAEVKFTNSANGKLSVSKAVNGTAADQTLSFNFKVELGDQTISGTYGEMDFTNGVAAFTLKDGETMTAEGLPAGITYVVTEEENGYIVTKSGDEGTIPAGATAEAKFTNTLNASAGDLKVSKTITGNDADMTRKFAFTVTLSSAAITGVYGDMEFVEGEAHFELGHEESRTAKGLPAGLGYFVTEKADGYNSIKTGDIGTIPAGGMVEAAFRNDRSSGFGGLTVTKTVAGDAADITDRFVFTVTLDVALNGTYGDMTFVNGVATFELGHNESKTANHLPEGTRYAVTEEAGSYTATVTGSNGVIAANTIANVRFVNSRSISRGNLLVTKMVMGEDGSKTQPFEFTVELTGANLNGTFGDMTFVNGVANFTLTDGQSKTAVGLPSGIAYRVTEKNGEYVVTKTGDVGYIPAHATVTAAFTNHLSIARGSLHVTKIITGNAADVTRKFSFRVALDQPITGIYGDMNFVQGVATFDLGNGESVVAERLPAGVSYVVEELDFEDYIVTAVNEVGTIAEGATCKATFINERLVIDVPETGDSFMPAVYSVLLLLSAAFLCLFGIKAKRT